MWVGYIFNRLSLTFHRFVFVCCYTVSKSHPRHVWYVKTGVQYAVSSSEGLRSSYSTHRLPLSCFLIPPHRHFLVLYKGDKHSLSCFTQFTGDTFYRLVIPGRWHHHTVENIYLLSFVIAEGADNRGYRNTRHLSVLLCVCHHFSVMYMTDNLLWNWDTVTIFTVQMHYHGGLD